MVFSLEVDLELFFELVEELLRMIDQLLTFTLLFFEGMKEEEVLFLLLALMEVLEAFFLEAVHAVELALL